MATTSESQAVRARRVGNWLAVAVMVAAGLLALAQLAAHVAQPDEYLVRHLVIDDAIYYARPARNFVLGNGFSFDGLHRTSGVHPVWAIVATGLAALFADDAMLLRALVATSGLSWILAGVLVARLLWPWRVLAAVVATLGWWTAGIELRLAAMGMENGVHACLLALGVTLAVQLARTPVDDPAWRGRAWRLGVGAAITILSRVECGLLAAAWIGWFLWLRCRREPWRDALRGIAPLVLPALGFGAAWSLFSRAYFGDWTPVSGSVKAWMSATAPNPHGDFAGSLAYTVERTAAMATQPMVYAWSGVQQVLGVHSVAWLVAAAVALPIAAIAPTAVRALRRRAFAPALGPAVPFALFTAVHVLLMAKYLSGFLSYGVWYFALELLLVWLGLGVALAAARGRLARLAGWPLAVLVVVAIAQRGAVYLEPPPYRAMTPREGVDVGRYLARTLPPGTRIGSANAGFIAWEAPRLTVINLDGLMNDGRYLREYLMRNRVDAYMHEQGIEYFADHLPLAAWRALVEGRGMRLPPGMQPIFFLLDTADTANCVFAVPGADGSLPRARAEPLARVAFDALVRGVGQVVKDADRAAIPADAQIVASLLVPFPGELLHVVLPRAQARTAIDANELHQVGMAARIGGRVQLLSCDLPPDPVEAGAAFSIDTFWRPDAGLLDGGDLELGVAIDETDAAGAPTGRRLEVAAAPAYGTLPRAVWVPEQVLAQTFALRLPRDWAPGAHPVAVFARDAGGAIVGAPHDVGAIATR